MRMRRKALIIVATMMVSIFLVLHAIVSTVFLQSFAALEEQKTSEEAKRTTVALSNEIADVSSSVSDWAFWDDTYAFVQSGNQSYISSARARTLLNSDFNRFYFGFMGSGQFWVAHVFFASLQ